MRSEGGLVPDEFTLPCAINACGDLKVTDEIDKIHGLAFKVGISGDVFVSSAMVNFYVKFGSVKVAEKLFDEMPERDVVLWNSMANGFAQVGKFEDSLRFYNRMESEGILPDSYTVTGIISVSTATGDMVTGRRIHELVKKFGYDSDVSVCNSLIDMYGKFGEVEEAVAIFETMPKKDLYSWNSTISMYQREGDHDSTMKLFDEMQKTNCPPDIVTICTILPVCTQLSALMRGRELHGYIIRRELNNEPYPFVENVLMDMYAKSGSLHNARSVFDTMQTQDTASWNILIGGYSCHGKVTEALEIFSTMCSMGIHPNDVTFVAVLSACSHTGLVDRGRRILDHMETDYNVTPTLEHYSCVVDMLGRAGRLSEAHSLLTNMPVESNPVVWRSYIAACQVHGDTHLAVEAANRLLEIEPEYGGSYVMLSNLYGSAGRYQNVSEIRLCMKIQNVRKIPGCSWMELKTGMHTFISRDISHPESDQIYSMLEVLIGRLRELGYVPDPNQKE